MAEGNYTEAKTVLVRPATQGRKANVEAGEGESQGVHPSVLTRRALVRFGGESTQLLRGGKSTQLNEIAMKQIWSW